jgi:hypothetical protein
LFASFATNQDIGLLNAEPERKPENLIEVDLDE